MTSVQPSARQKHSYTPTQIGRYILGVSFLRNILIAFMLVALLFPLYSWLYLTPAYRNLLTRLSEDEARRTAVHLMRTLEIGVVPLNEAVSRADMLLSVAELKTDFQLRKLKLFDPDGRVIFSTDPQEAGTVNQHAYFIDKVAKGHIHSHLVKSGGLTLERAETAVDVVEIYVPIMLNEAFMGAFEIYYDISAAQSQLAAVQQRSHLTMLIIALCMLVIAAVILFKAGSAMLAHREMDHALHKGPPQSGETGQGTHPGSYRIPYRPGRERIALPHARGDHPRRHPGDRHPGHHHLRQPGPRQTLRPRRRRADRHLHVRPDGRRNRTAATERPPGLPG